MFDFKKAAQENTVLCAIMAGKKKLETKDVVDRELTVVAFDFAPKYDEKRGEFVINPATGEPDTYGVVVFAEMPDSYYSVGTVFTKVCRAWMAGYDSAEEASADLMEYGGVKVKFSQAKAKNGNNLTTVQILD